MESERNPIASTSPRAGHGDTSKRRASRIWVPVVAFVVTVIAVGSALYSLNRDAIPDEIAGLIEYGDLPSIATNDAVAYSITPPPGGQHALASLECGRYTIPVEDERAVAALATGAVWIAYDPEIEEHELENLEIFEEGEIDVVMAPYPDLPEPIVITAWGVQLYPDSAEDTRIASFMRDYLNADSAPFPNLSCRDGVEIPGAAAVTPTS